MENTYTYINFNRLANTTFDSFHYRVAEAAASITLEDVVSLLATYNANNAKFHEFVKNDAVTSAKTLAKDTVAARTAAFVSYRSAVRQLCKSPSATDAALGKELWALVKNYVKISSWSQADLTSVVKNTINDSKVIIAKETYATAYASAGLKVYFDKVVETEAAFEAADQLRSNNRTERLQDSNEGVRDACIKCYTDLVCCARAAVAAKSDANCKEFLNKVADIVKFTRSLYITRASRRAKANEEASSTSATESATASAATNAAETAASEVKSDSVATETVKVETANVETANTETVKEVA